MVERLGSHLGVLSFGAFECNGLADAERGLRLLGRGGRVAPGRTWRLGA